MFYQSLDPRSLCSKSAMTDTTFYVVTLGYKSTLKTLRSGKAKLVIIAGNTPPLRTYHSESIFSFSDQTLGFEIFFGVVLLGSIPSPTRTTDRVIV